MPTAPFLPKTQAAEGTYTFAGEAGSWNLQPDFLTTLPANMDLGREQIKSHALTSIPDSWARMHFFHNALLNIRHPAHDSVENEWRGLLGLICCADAFRLQIRDEFKNLPQLGAALVPIAQILNELVPADQFRDIWLLHVNDQLVGATSPYSFVFTSPDCNVPLSVPWRDRETGLLYDPVVYLSQKTDQASQSMLKVLKGWIDDLLQKTGGLALNDNERIDLNRQLTAWRDSIGLDSEAPQPSNRAPIQVIRNKVALQPPLVQAPVESEVQISPEALRPGYNKTKYIPIVYWSSWKEPGVDMVVLGHYKSASIEEPHAARGDALAPGRVDAPFIKPEDLFFTDTLTRLSVGLPAEAVYNTEICTRDGERYLLPLTRAIFDYFDARFLAEHLRLEVHDDETATLILRIPLTGGGVAIVKREYARREIETEFASDAIAIWPNKVLPKWRLYYLYAHLPQAADRESRKHLWKCRPCGPQTVVKSPEAVGNCYWRLNGPPDGISFERTEQVKSNTPTAERVVTRELGVIIPKFDRTQVAQSSGASELAVDFGTSNTAIAFMKEPTAGRPDPLNFRDRLLVLMRGKNHEDSTFWTATNFISEHEESLRSPFPSIYYPFPFVQQTENRPLLDGIIPFEQSLIYPFKAVEYDAYATGLKWAKEPNMIALVGSFLKQVFIMAFFETRSAGKDLINLSWTYPSAFEPGRRQRFAGAWVENSKAIAADTGVVVKHETERSSKVTESIAVCRYAQKFAGSGWSVGGRTRASLTLDIGGGTTDIAIWREGRVQAQSSLLLAGDAVASYFKRSPEFCREMLHEWSKVDDPMLGVWVSAITQSKNSGSAVNEMFRRHGEKIQAGLSAGIAASPGAQRALSVVTCLMGGLAYYAGMMLEASHPDEESIKGIDVLYAGNVSRLLKWIGPEDIYRERMTEFLLAGYRRPLGANHVTVRASMHPKMEAAMGIICDVRIEYSDISEPVILLGEDGFSLNGDSYDRFFDMGKLTASDLNRWQGIKISSDLPALNGFIDQYNKAARSWDLDAIGKDFDISQLQNEIEDHFYQCAGDPDNVPLMSPFVIGLRHVLNHLIEG